LLIDPVVGAFMFGLVIAFALFVGVPVLSLVAGQDSRPGVGDGWKHRTHRGDL
jgi:hypothetical protein